MFTRREMIKMGLISAPALWLGRGGSGKMWALQKTGSTPGFVPYLDRLPIPHALQPLNQPGPGLNMARADVIRIQTMQDGKTFSRPVPDMSPDMQDADYYDIEVKSAMQQVLQVGPETQIFGYSQAGEKATWPGPTIVAKRNRMVMACFQNKLVAPEAQPVVVHYHGGHTPPGYDSYPSEGIMPGHSREYGYPNSSTRSATLWYHDHFDNELLPNFEGTGHNVYMGLAGFYILQPSGDDVDETTAENKLPSGPVDPQTRLGIFDIPMVVQDRVFDANNQLVYQPFDFDGVLGETILVNGKVQPFLNVEPRQYRFRFLNGSNARLYQLSFSRAEFQSLNPEKFFQVGIDGGLLPAAVSRDSFLIAMGERDEVVFDFSSFAGTSLFLVNCLQQTSGRRPDDVTPDNCTPLMRFDVLPSATGFPDTAVRDGTPLLDLRGEENPSEAEAVIEREFKFDRSHGGWTINGEFFQPGVVSRDGEGKLVTPKLGTVEIWRLTNSSGGWWHPAHVHMEEFKILSRNELPPEPWERGLKDMFVLGGGDTIRAITKFKGQDPKWVQGGGQDNVGIYVFHCHNLEHEDMHMMGNFQVVK